MSLTVIIIIATAAFSIWAFQRSDIFEKYLLSPYMVVQRKEWYRIFSHGFLHVDWLHLIVNMMVFFSFGKYMEHVFSLITPFATFHFLALYFGGMLVASMPAIVKHKNDYGYRSVGASGAVAAILFAYIFFSPWDKILFFGIIPVPAILFGVIYLAYSNYMDKKGGDNVAHDAHFYGALFGFLYPLAINPKLLFVFIEKLTSF